MNLIKKVTDPHIISASEIPSNSDANPASVVSCSVVATTACLDGDRSEKLICPADVNLLHLATLGISISFLQNRHVGIDISTIIVNAQAQLQHSVNSVAKGVVLLQAEARDRISMVAYRDELCFTTVLRTFTNTSRNRTSYLHLIEIKGGSDLVVGTYQGSSVDSKEDLLVTRDEFLRNLDLTSGNSSDFTGFFSNESISSSFSQSSEVEPESMTAVNAEMTRKLFGRDDEVAARDWTLKWDTR
ncbi:hypothetical protein RJ640_013966 [Escallonia rubra]|uniref:Uncharacterized protein n=1 Tax=Escallonia rubra TaxID=112253 RepID=A0AA88UAA0_9ASTE|nr:hypothetical protein RJ640_013966 [Escallonia rubra]